MEQRRQYLKELKGRNVVELKNKSASQNNSQTVTELLRGRYHFVEAKETKPERIFRTISLQDVGYFLYKRRDHENKVPQQQTCSINKQKIALGKLLKTAINADLVLTSNSSVKKTWKPQILSHELDETIDQ